MKHPRRNWKNVWLCSVLWPIDWSIL